MINWDIVIGIVIGWATAFNFWLLFLRKKEDLKK